MQCKRELDKIKTDSFVESRQYRTNVEKNRVYIWHHWGPITPKG
jgi:hypothetical protein